MSASEDPSNVPVWNQHPGATRRPLGPMSGNLPTASRHKPSSKPLTVPAARSYGPLCSAAVGQRVGTELPQTHQQHGGAGKVQIEPQVSLSTSSLRHAVSQHNNSRSSCSAEQDAMHLAGSSAPQHSNRPAPSSTAGQHSPPTSSSAALHRLQHQQQLRWQQHISKTGAPVSDSAGRGHAVPFSLHPAVSSAFLAAITGACEDDLSPAASSASSMRTAGPACGRSPAPASQHTAPPALGLGAPSQHKACHHSSDASSCITAGPVRCADSRTGTAHIPAVLHTAGWHGSSSMPLRTLCVSAQQPQARFLAGASQPGSLMFVRPHRSQQLQQPAQLNNSTRQQHPNLFSMAGVHASLPDANLLQLAASSSGSAVLASQQTTSARAPTDSWNTATVPQQQQIHAAAAPAANGQARAVPAQTACSSRSVSRSASSSQHYTNVMPQVSCRSDLEVAADIDGLSLGPMTAALRAPRTSGLAVANRLARPQTAVALAGGSILDTVSGIPLRQEGGSSATAIQGMSAAAAEPKAHRGSTLELLASKAATWLQRQQAQRASSRLQAASYPAAPCQQDLLAAASAKAATQHSTDPVFAAGTAAMSMQLSSRHPVSMSDATGIRLDSMRAPAPTSSSIGSTGRVSADTASSLAGSRLSLWQGQPSAESATGRQRLSMGGELRASFSGALRCTTGTVRGSPVARPAGNARVRSSRASICSPAKPISSRSCANVFFTPEAADASSDSACTDTSDISLNSLTDTAVSASSYALRAHMLGLARGSPYVGLVPDADDDYILTALHEQHGRAAHAATYWIAGVRDKRARQLGSRACRRLTWGDDEDHQRWATPRQPHPALAALLCMRY